jgi:hypothetical protein
VDLQTQVQDLIDHAPLDAQTRQAVAAIAPVLVSQAQQYQATIYYVVQTVDGQWQIITLEHQEPPHTEKVVIYGYATPDMAQAAIEDETNLVIQPIPVIQLLFQLLAAEPVDSLILLEAPNGEQGWEVSRQDLQKQASRALNLPPNIA